VDGLGNVYVTGGSSNKAFRISAAAVVLALGTTGVVAFILGLALSAIFVLRRRSCDSVLE
jgi:hypothetical protein